MQRVVEVLLATALAAAGTQDVDYPSGFDENHFATVGHKISVKDGGELLQGRDFAISFAKTKATITAATGFTTLPVGTTLFVELHLRGEREDKDLTNIRSRAGVANAGNRQSRRQIVEVNFGAPATLDADGICESQNRTGAGVLLINGALSDGDLATSVATLDVPRNVIADSGGADTAVITITGKDEYGETVVESITLNGATAVAGKKAFKTITSVVSDATISNGFFLGTGDVLGLPVYLPNVVHVLYDTEDGAAITDGTYVAGVLTKPTSTTGDVRGTYDPNSACDGGKNFTVVMLLENPEFIGVPQYAG
jgi:hypothetical protein